MRHLQKRVATYNEHGKEVIAESSEVRKWDAHEVHTFEELKKKVSYLSYANPSFKLLFRGQDKDYTSVDGASKLLPSILRSSSDSISRYELEERKKKLSIAENELVTMWGEKDLRHGEDLQRSKLRRWAILQHYGDEIKTPLLDVTQSLQVACTIAHLNDPPNPHVYILAFPKIGGAISTSAEEHLQTINLSNICPPSAKRAHHQQGLLVGEYPSTVGSENIRQNTVREIDFGRRLLGKFKIGKRRSSFWDIEAVPRLPNSYIFPKDDNDEVLELVTSAIKETERKFDDEDNKEEAMYRPIIKTAEVALSENYPLTFFSDFTKYRNFAINLSKKATDKLIWTMFGSPIKAVDNKYHCNKLTEEDQFFGEVHQPKNGKYRIVIFKDEDEIETYVNSKDSERVQAFEQSVREGGGQLFFTSTNLLVESGHLSEKGMHDMDLGIIFSSDDQGFFFESGFSTNLESRKSYKFHTTTGKLDRPDLRGYNDSMYKGIFSDIPEKKDLAFWLSLELKEGEVPYPLFDISSLDNLYDRAIN